MPTNVQMKWLQGMAPAAQTTARLWGVPASVTLAQCVLESAWGTSQLSRQANNYFGIKAVAGQDYAEFPTHEVVQGRTVTELAHFARFGSVMDCFAAHAHLLGSCSRYNVARGQDAAGWCRQLQSGGYSTSPTYAASLLSLIRSLGLDKFDGVAGSVTPAAGGGS